MDRMKEEKAWGMRAVEVDGVRSGLMTLHVVDADLAQFARGFAATKANDEVPSHGRLTDRAEEQP